MKAVKNHIAVPALGAETAEPCRPPVEPQPTELEDRTARSASGFSMGIFSTCGRGRSIGKWSRPPMASMDFFSCCFQAVGKLFDHGGLAGTVTTEKCNERHWSGKC